MLFNSLQFLYFFVIVIILYFLLPHKFRWIHLLLASCYFYMVFFPVYILILGFTIIIDYFAGIYLEKLQGKNRKIFLIISLIANIGVLAVFKYYNFLNQNLSDFLSIFGHHSPLPILSILLPIGLSFHTFQAMSYTIEVYRNNVKAEKNFGIYALYVMFFPQLVAGPIERPQNLLPQLHKQHHFDFEEFKIGLMQMAFGFFKKVVIADRLALVVDDVYGHVDTQNGSTMLVAAFFYAFQIYCDFSGYSDIAIGAARIMGIKLMTNFNVPYLSKSIAEFWKRWHISLSTWFKDYLYISLGGNRVSVLRWLLNLFLVFLISGLWHGANWTFVIWGALHGSYMLFAIAKNKLNSYLKIPAIKGGFGKILQISTTFFLVCFAWIFFRATNFSHAMQIINKIAHISLKDNLRFILNSTEMWFCIILILILLLKERFYLKIQTKNTASFFIVIAVVIFSSYLFGIFNNKQFIYFQF